MGEKDSSSVSSHHVASQHFGYSGQKYSRKRRGQTPHLLANIKAFGLQSAAMFSINSDSLLPESAAYTSAIHVYIHHAC